MKRFAMTVMLKNDPETIRRYEEYHAHAWPETEAGLRTVGIQRMFIYRFGRQLFMFAETADDFDIDRDLARYTEGNPRAKEWDDLMRTFQETAPGAPSGATWVLMKEVYALKQAAL